MCDRASETGCWESIQATAMPNAPQFSGGFLRLSSNRPDTPASALPDAEHRRQKIRYLSTHLAFHSYEPRI
jgi:hypothetical protein